MTIVFLKCGPNIPRSSSFVPNLSIFVFAQYFAVRQIKGRWFQIFFKKNPSPKILQTVLVSNLRIFIFAAKFAIRQFQGAEIKYGNIIFKF